MRIVDRATRYAGVNQTDFHADQFIFPPCSEKDMLAGTPAITCINFAFATQHTCLCHTPVGQDWQMLMEAMECAGVAVLGDKVVDTYFTPRDEHEW